jgi:cytidylate kinase
MSYRIIAIGRQFGSGGSTIARKLAERLGIPCYDEVILERMAAESGFAPEYLKEQAELSASRNWLGHALSAGMFAGNSYQDELWNLQNKIISELAEKGPCVFVGFCSEYILRKHDNCLRAFIYADVDKRVQRILEQYGDNGVAPEKRVKDMDRRRATYYQYYTDLKWGAARNYHISLNSGTMGIDACVDILENLY